MQDLKVIEREARRRLPKLLADLLDEPDVELEPIDDSDGRQIDLAGHDSRGRTWMFEVKASSRPGQVVRAAEQLRAYATSDAIPIVVVPYMSPAGARVAEREGINWIDLSGNAQIRAENLHVWVQGRRNELRSRGRPSTPFAPKSARVTRVMLVDPNRWWRQKDLAEATGLDDGSVSRTVGRLDQEHLIERRGRELRPRDPDLLLDAWSQDYRFDRHDVVTGHLSGSGIELARSLAGKLTSHELPHAFTGLPAAWALDQFASFRLTSVYVRTDPREAAEQIGMRMTPKGANVQLIGPNDNGVFTGEQEVDGLRCVVPVQAYLDLQHLPERASEAAMHLREHHLRWRGGRTS